MILENVRVRFYEPNKADLEHVSIDTAELAENRVIVKTMRAAISSGTDRANFQGQRVFNMTEEMMQDWHRTFPRYPGYTGAGEVIAVGAKVKKVKVGDRVVYWWGRNQRYNVMPETQVTPIPDGISYEEAAFAFISTFPLAAVRKVRLEIGEPCLVMGLGILGQFAVSYMKIGGGAPVIAADPVKERRDEALKYGADYAFDPMEEGFAAKVKEITGGGVNAAIEVTGVGAGLNETLDCMAKYGRVALLGCTRDSNFSVDFYKKVHYPGIELIGAHTDARPARESHHGYYTHEDDIRCCMRLAALGMLDLKRILKEMHTPEEAPKVYSRLGSERNFPIGVLFDWSHF